MQRGFEQAYGWRKIVLSFGSCFSPENERIIKNVEPKTGRSNKQKEFLKKSVSGGCKKIVAGVLRPRPGNGEVSCPI